MSLNRGAKGVFASMASFYVSSVLTISALSSTAWAAPANGAGNAWLPSYIFLGVCALIIVLQLIQGGYRPDPREDHRYIEEKLREFGHENGNAGK